MTTVHWRHRRYKNILGNFSGLISKNVFYLIQDIVKAEVAKLLDLKKKLAAVTGNTNAAAPADAGGKGGKGKSKGKKK